MHELEQKLLTWMELVGWVRNPFAHEHEITRELERAEDEPDDWIASFIEEVLYPGLPQPAPARTWQTKNRTALDSLQEFNRPKIVFGHTGTGKTHLRRLLAQQCRRRAHPRDYVEYVQVIRPVPNRDTPFSIQEHIDNIVALLPTQPGDQMRVLLNERTAKSLRKELHLPHPVILIDPDSAADEEPEQFVSQIHHLFAAGATPLWRHASLVFFLPTTAANEIRKRYSTRFHEASDTYPDTFHLAWGRAQLQTFLRERMAFAGSEAVAEFNLPEKLVQSLTDEQLTPRLANRRMMEVVKHHARSAPDQPMISEDDLRAVVEKAAVQPAEQPSGNAPAPVGSRKWYDCLFRRSV